MAEVTPSEPGLLAPTAKTVKSPVEDSLTQAKVLVQALALADGAIKASAAEWAKQQLHKEEDIRNLASELVISRQQQIATLVREAADGARRLESLVHRLIGDSSDLQKEQLGAAAKEQISALYFDRLQSIKMGGSLAKSLTAKEVLELSAAATMAMSTLSPDLLAEHEKHAALEERTHRLRISSKDFEAKQKQIERLRQQGTVCSAVPQHHCMLIQLVFPGTSATEFSTSAPTS
jgi:hypothetical protein